MLKEAIQIIDAERLENCVTALSRVGRLGAEAGYLRAAYSTEETAAMRLIEAAGQAAGLVPRWDVFRNLVLETPGSFAEWVETGSHLDTVPYGGAYDGAAGVAAGLEALCTLTAGAPLQRGLRLRVWRGEESSTFNSVSTGSKAAFGVLPPALLENRFGGRTLAEAMRSQGADPHQAAAGQRSIPQSEVDGIRAHLELHIEQGTVLERGAYDVGVVTGIRGPCRMWVRLYGEFDHSGATPMGASFRKDANLALGYILVRLDRLAAEELKRGADLVQTVGVINSSRDLNAAHAGLYQNAVPKVSGFAYFSLDIRSSDNDFRSEYVLAVRAAVQAEAAELGVAVEIEVFSEAPGLPQLDAEVQELAVRSCTELKLPYVRLPSGAWHDAALVLQQRRSGGDMVPGGMLFIPCRGGKSHCPEEYCSLEQIARGAAVLTGVMGRLAAA